jgi:copper chaperone NosL
MKKYQKIIMRVGALLLLVLFMMPIWRITLEAPQYPGGITMYIWIDKITGDSEFTLQNINILNHYIGMKFNEPDSIPELSYFPYIVIAMSLLGVIFSFVGNRKLVLTWIITMVSLGILGIYDFYLWEYDYGHNLDPMAPIKVPGMVYQPPVFGSKMLLNFNAISYPHWGSLFLALSIIMAMAAYYMSRGNGKLNQSSSKYES